MRVYAIADPHLSRVHPKPMTVFGAGWEGHPEAFFRGWREVVGEEDLVVVPGDISWAMRLSEAIPDLLDLARLPGRKVLLKGNHDYWWPSISRLRAALPPGMYALQNDALVVDGVAVAGTRGWQYPPQTPEDEKVFAREVERLKLSLKALEGQPYRHLVVAFHFPPSAPGGGLAPPGARRRGPPPGHRLRPPPRGRPRQAAAKLPGHPPPPGGGGRPPLPAQAGSGSGLRLYSVHALAARGARGGGPLPGHAPGTAGGVRGLRVPLPGAPGGHGPP